MESRANYVAVGLFVLVMLMAGLGFLYWLTSAGERTQQVQLRIIFTESVSGLNTGSSVLFNGIRIGEVQSLSLDPADPNTVVAIASVDGSVPIRTDTTATLSFSGLTGSSALSLAGGSRNAPLLIEAVPPGEGMPTIHARVSPFSDILESARSVLVSADSAMAAIDEFITDNEAAVGRAVTNVETFTSALADNSSEIGSLISDVSSTAQNIGAMSGDLRGVVTQAEAILGAVDPASVTALVDNAVTASERLERMTAAAETVINGVDAAQINEAVADVIAATQSLRDTVDRTNTVVAAVNPQDIADIVADARSVSSRLDAISARTEALVTAIDPQRVDEILASTDTLTTNLATASASIGQLLGTAQAVATQIDGIAGAVVPEDVRSTVADVAAFAGRLQGTGDSLDTILADARSASARLDAISERTEALVTAVDPTRLSEILAATETLTRNLSNASGSVGQLLQTAQTVATRVDGVVGAIVPADVRSTVADIAAFAGRLEGTGDTLDAILADARVASADVAAVTARVNARGEDIDAVISDARAFAADLTDISQRAQTLLDSANGFIEGSEGDGGLMEQATAAVVAVREAAEAINAQVGPISSDIASFSDRGLNGIEQFFADGRRALQRLDNILSSVERNPQQFIFGGEGVPEYAPRRR